MEIVYILIGVIVGIILAYFGLKSNLVARKNFNELNQKFISSEADLKNSIQKNENLEYLLSEAKANFFSQNEDLMDMKTQFSEINTIYKSQILEIENLKESKIQQNQEIKLLQTQKESLSVEKERLSAKNDSLNELLNHQKQETQKIQQLAKEEFQNLAQKILEEKTEKFTHINETKLKGILEPFQEKIQHFEHKVEQTHKENIDYHAALRQQIFGLKELNNQMSKDAINLTRALKGDSKTQGNWGELVLERVLEKSGLEKDREYFVQQNFTNEETHRRQMPDVVIHLPDQKKMIIDSKVSLTAYEQFVSTENEDEKQNFLKAHLDSLHKHIFQLSAKKYEDIYTMESPDFVLLFIPIEPAFAVAINHDNEIYNRAFEKNIVIVTPTTLLATLRTIDSMWNNEKQQRNALEIAKQAGSLYDKFEGLLKDLINIGKKINSTKTDYELAMNKLTDGRGNLIKSVEKLKKMGAKAKKNIPRNLIERANDNDEEND